MNRGIMHSHVYRCIRCNVTSLMKWMGCYNDVTKLSDSGKQTVYCMKHLYLVYLFLNVKQMKEMF